MFYNHIKEHKNIYNINISTNEILSINTPKLQIIYPVIVNTVIRITGFNSVERLVTFFIKGCFCVIKTYLKYWIVRYSYN
jgi:hypothetical protein